MDKLPPKTRRVLARYAQQIVQRAVHMGLLINLHRPYHGIKCLDCGKVAIVWEHRNYAKPMSVEPVCRSCNKLRGPANQPTREECLDLLATMVRF